MARLGCLALCLILATGFPANAVEMSATSGKETVNYAIPDCPPLFPDWWCL